MDVDIVYCFSSAMGDNCQWIGIYRPHLALWYAQLSFPQYVLAYSCIHHYTLISTQHWCTVMVNHMLIV